MGGGIASACSQVGAQASVTHGDVAITTALVLLLTEIGGSVGGAIGEYHSSFLASSAVYIRYEHDIDFPPILFYPPLRSRYVR